MLLEHLLMSQNALAFSSASGGFDKTVSSFRRAFTVTVLWLARNEGMAPYSSPYVTHYSSFHFLFFISGSTSQGHLDVNKHPIPRPLGGSRK